jgi:hypothetical protein
VHGRGRDVAADAVAGRAPDLLREREQVRRHAAHRIEVVGVRHLVGEHRDQPALAQHGGVDQLDPQPDAVLLGRVEDRPALAAERLEDAAHQTLRDLRHDRVLAGEVLVQRRDVDASALGDVVGGRAGVAEDRQELRAGVDDRVEGLLRAPLRRQLARAQRERGALARRSRPARRAAHAVLRLR